MSGKLSLEKIKRECGKRGAELVGEYIRNDILIKLKCSCGVVFERCWINIQKRNVLTCNECSDKRTHKQQRFSLEYVKNIFLERGAIAILDEYRNAKQKIKFICSEENCFNIGQISVDQMRLTDKLRCRKCIHQYAYKRGSLSSSFNPNLTEEDRKERRLIPGYREWREKVKMIYRDTCPVSGSKDIEVHHIFSWRDYPGLRFEDWNGIVLAKKLHRRFHKMYGYTENNPGQLKSFLNEIFEMQKINYSNPNKNKFYYSWAKV